VNGPSVPVILVVDPGGTRSATVRRLDERYASTYDVVAATSRSEAADRLEALRASARDVAVVLADRAHGGTDVLRDVARLHPQARRGLLLHWNEGRSHREEIADAFSQRAVECVVTRPAGPHDERFHRSVAELLDEWWRIHGTAAARIRVVAEGPSVRLSEIGDLLQRHDLPYVVELVDSDAGRATLERLGLSAARLPVVEIAEGFGLVDPTNVEVADALGARTRPGEGAYDVVVVGAGPAGLSAAVYARTEGLRTVLVEPIAMGGQAGTSSMIRNYLGFPRGISGSELAARAFEQALLFGTEMVYGSGAVGLATSDGGYEVTLDRGDVVSGRTVVIATGVSYRRLGIDSLEALSGAGVFYGAATTEAPSLRDEDVFVVGGGNSAGQAAVHLARYARQVTILVRGDSLAASMSDYLVTEIEAAANIAVRYRTTVVGGSGDDRLERLDLRDVSSGGVTTVDAAALFVLIGAEPFTGWLPSEVARDDWGYILTGLDDGAPERLAFETQLPGVFAVGDVRRGSVKRVASAVGEGAVCVRLIHEHLARVGADGGPVGT
jgi:thioredoxin reductase (NADPH)